MVDNFYRVGNTRGRRWSARVAVEQDLQYELAAPVGQGQQGKATQGPADGNGAPPAEAHPAPQENGKHQPGYHGEEGLVGQVLSPEVVDKEEPAEQAQGKQEKPRPDNFKQQGFHGLQRWQTLEETARVMVAQAPILIGQQQGLHGGNGEQAVGQQGDNHVTADPQRQVLGVDDGVAEQQAADQHRGAGGKQQYKEAVERLPDAAEQDDQVHRKQNQHTHRPQGEVDAGGCGQHLQCRQAVQAQADDAADNQPGVSGGALGVEALKKMIERRTDIESGSGNSRDAYNHVLRRSGPNEWPSLSQKSRPAKP